MEVAAIEPASQEIATSSRAAAAACTFKLQERLLI
jgi:hypothetical protein